MGRLWSHYNYRRLSQRSFVLMPGLKWLSASSGVHLCSTGAHFVHWGHLILNTARAGCHTLFLARHLGSKGKQTLNCIIWGHTSCNMTYIRMNDIYVYAIHWIRQLKAATTFELSEVSWHWLLLFVTKESLDYSTWAAREQKGICTLQQLDS